MTCGDVVDTVRVATMGEFVRISAGIGDGNGEGDGEGEEEEDNDGSAWKEGIASEGRAEAFGTEGGTTCGGGFSFVVVDDDDNTTPAC